MLTDVNEVNAPEQFNVNIFPNPAHNTLNFNSDYTHGNLSVLIINSQGQEMTRFAFNSSFSLDVSDWNAGIYLVKILGGTEKTMKVVIK